MNSGMLCNRIRLQLNRMQQIFMYARYLRMAQWLRCLIFIKMTVIWYCSSWYL